MSLCILKEERTILVREVPFVRVQFFRKRIDTHESSHVVIEAAAVCQAQKALGQKQCTFTALSEFIHPIHNCDTLKYGQC